MSPHGTRSRYSHGRCRCEACTAANRAYDQQRRQQQHRDPTYNLPVAPDADRSWMEHAACRGRSDLFFPNPGSGHPNRRYHDAARTICATCPVQHECRSYAITIDAQHGIWAGQTANELKAS